MPTAIPVEVDLHSRQAQVLREAQRFNVLAAGRRWGKSTLSLLLMAETAGERAGRVGYFAPSYKLLSETWRDMDADFGPILVERSITERRMKMLTGGVVEMWSLDDMDAGRSRKYNRVIIDEAGLVPHLGETWDRAIRPTLADLSGDAWFLGTPKGRNFFWHAFQRGSDPLWPDWQAWQFPTSSNPWIKPDEVEAMRAGMTDRAFAQECLAEFLEDGGGVFRFIRESATAEPQSAAIVVNPGTVDEETHRYVIGCDWGRTGDYTVFAVVDQTLSSLVHLERFSGVPYAQQRARLQALRERFAGAYVVAETNSIGGPVLEELQREGMPVQGFHTSNATKAEAIDALALAFEQRAIRIIPDPVLIAELEAFESRRLPSGMVQYSAPEGMHDDCVVALMIAWHAGAPHRQWAVM